MSRYLSPRFYPFSLYKFLPSFYQSIINNIAISLKVYYANSLTSQVLVLAIGDVSARAQISELLGETEVNHVQLVAMPPDAHQEVVRLDVSVDEALAVDKFHATQHLIW